MGKWHLKWLSHGSKINEGTTSQALVTIFPSPCAFPLMQDCNTWLSFPHATLPIYLVSFLCPTEIQWGHVGNITLSSCHIKVEKQTGKNKFWCNILLKPVCLKLVSFQYKTNNYEAFCSFLLPPPFCLFFLYLLLFSIFSLWSQPVFYLSIIFQFRSATMQGLSSPKGQEPTCTNAANPSKCCMIPHRHTAIWWMVIHCLENHLGGNSLYLKSEWTCLWVGSEKGEPGTGQEVKWCARAETLAMEQIHVTHTVSNLGHGLSCFLATRGITKKYFCSKCMFFFLKKKNQIFKKQEFLYLLWHSRIPVNQDFILFPSVNNYDP